VAEAKNKVIVISENTCRILGGNGFAAKHSITCNYNNSALEDGLFHFIMRLLFHVLEGGGGGGGGGEHPAQ